MSGGQGNGRGVLCYGTIVIRYGTAWQEQYGVDNPVKGLAVVEKVLRIAVLRAPTVICSGLWRMVNLRTSCTLEVVVDQTGSRERILYWFVWYGRVYTVIDSSSLIVKISLFVLAQLVHR